MVAKGSMGSEKMAMRYIYELFIFNRVLFVRPKDLYNEKVH